MNQATKLVDERQTKPSKASKGTDGGKKQTWLARHRSTTDLGIAGAMQQVTSRNTHLLHTSAYTLDHHQQPILNKPALSQWGISADSGSSIVSRVYNTRGKTIPDYREYPTTAKDTLRHHKQLWSLPYVAEEAYPVRYIGA